MTIQAIPSYNTLKALKTSKKYNTPENIASQNSNKQITQLPHYNSSVFFHPSFMGLIKSSTTEALKNQSKSNLYHFNPSEKTEEIPPSFVNCFSDKKTNIIGAGSIFSNFFLIDNIFDSYFGNRERLSLYDPKFADTETFDGYNILGSMDEAKEGSAFLFSPNRFHAQQIKTLSKREGLDGVYVDKPMCISRKELKKLKKTVKNSKIPLYFGDYFYFAQTAGLRLMGVDMPYKESITIEFDNSKDKKFTSSIDKAVPFFKKDEIHSIYCNFSEQGADDLLERKWMRNRSDGGGVLLDLQVHVFNLLNLMGLELTDIESVDAKKFPWRNSKMPNPYRECEKLLYPIKQRGIFIPLQEGDVEDYVSLTGKINGSVTTQINVAQYMRERSNEICIEGKNSQKIKITTDDFNKKVELLDANDNVIARAHSDVRSYALMLHHAQTYFTDKNTNKTPMFFDTQVKSLEQIFDIQDIIYK